MPSDHFIPRTYLRGFTREYLTGERGGELVVYNHRLEIRAVLASTIMLLVSLNFIITIRSIGNGRRRSSEIGERFATD